MRLPFTLDEFFAVFARYNEAIWPLQWALTALGVIAVALAIRGTPGAARAISGILGLLWIWTGAVYHLTYFREINGAAAAFGGAFIVQGLIFWWLGAYRRRLVIADPGGLRRAAGAVVMLYALLGYPALGYLLGHRYPEAPTFGAPCPTTILTFGLLAWAANPIPRTVLIVPVLWALIGTSVVWQFGMLEDAGLIAAAVVAIVTTLRRPHSGSRGERRIAARLTEAT